MKYRSLLLVSLVFLLSFSIYGEERNFDLKVSLEETSIDRTADEFFAKVTITNNSKQNLSTSGLGFVEFRFSKSMIGNSQGLIKNDYIARVEIPHNNLRQNRSFEFKVDLVGQDWFITNSNTAISGIKTSFAEISEENIFFNANIKLLTGYKNVANPKVVYKDGKAVNEPISKRPTYKTINSNIISVTLN